MSNGNTCFPEDDIKYSNETILSFLSDLLLVDFYEKKANKGLINTREIKHTTIKDLSLYPIEGIHNIPEYIEQYPIVYNILELGDGKISLCGLGLSQIIRGEVPLEFDLYIHSCSKDEANSLFQECLGLIDNPIKYSKRDDYFVFILDDEDGNGYYIRLFLDLYEDKTQILRNNYNCLEKHCWDPINGCLATTSTIFSLQLDLITDNIDLYDETQIISVLHSINANIIDKDEIYNVAYCLNKDIIFSPRIEEQMGFGSSVPYPVIFMKPFVPKVINITECFGEVLTNYQKVKIGISDDRYVAFYGCKKLYNIPNEIFGLLCLHWLKQEALIAKQRVLNKY